MARIMVDDGGYVSEGEDLEGLRDIEGQICALMEDGEDIVSRAGEANAMGPVGWAADTH